MEEKIDNLDRIYEEEIEDNYKGRLPQVFRNLIYHLGIDRRLEYVIERYMSEITINSKLARGMEEREFVVGSKKRNTSPTRSSIKSKMVAGEMTYKTFESLLLQVCDVSEIKISVEVKMGKNNRNMVPEGVYKAKPLIIRNAGNFEEDPEEPPKEDKEECKKDGK